MLHSPTMNLPPVDLVYLRERFNELAARVQELWESSALAEQETTDPMMLSEAMDNENGSLYAIR